MPPATPADLFARLRALGIETRTHEHEAVFTVAQSAPVKAAIPGGHSKNLFLKNKAGRLFLVTAMDETRIDLKGLHVPLGAEGRLSFASADLLGEALGVLPGSVTPFALMNDRAGRVTAVLDEALLACSPLNFHPLVNTSTTAIAPADLLRFLRDTGHEPVVLSLPEPPADP